MQPIPHCLPHRTPASRGHSGTWPAGTARCGDGEPPLEALQPAGPARCRDSRWRGWRGREGGGAQCCAGERRVRHRPEVSHPDEQPFRHSFLLPSRLAPSFPPASLPPTQLSSLLHSCPPIERQLSVCGSVLRLGLSILHRPTPERQQAEASSEVLRLVELHRCAVLRIFLGPARCTPSKEDARRAEVQGESDTRTPRARGEEFDVCCWDMRAQSAKRDACCA